MKLEVGMYVRTEYGIEKIVKIKESCTFAGFEEIINTDKNEYRDFIEHSKIKKASHNIIDLIEVGDFVDYEYPTGLGMWYCKNVEITEHLLNVFKNGENNHEYKITSIVTKEQFEQMQYKVGE